jgi:hypothetical protein
MNLVYDTLPGNEYLLALANEYLLAVTNEYLLALAPALRLIIP